MALASGAIDAWFTYDPYYADAEIQGIARALVTGGDVGYLNVVPIYVNSTYLAEEPETVHSFLRSYQAVTEWMNANPDGAAHVMAKTLHMSFEASRLTMRRRNYILDPAAGGHRAWLEQFNRASLALGAVASVPDMDSIIDDSVYAAAFARHADKSDVSGLL